MRKSIVWWGLLAMRELGSYVKFHYINVKGIHMITYNDYSYIETKKVIMGKKKNDSILRGLLEWINTTYSVDAVNICYEILTNHNPHRPRIEVVFRTDEPIRQFNRDDGYNYDESKQNEIRNKFIELVNQRKVSTNKLHNLFFRDMEYETNDILVVFSAFDPILISEINSKIQDKDLIQLEQKWSKYNIWKVTKLFGTVFFMFYKDTDIEQIKGTEVLEDMKDEYYLLLKKHDDLNILRRDQFEVVLDSKENFDNNYASNWYYYFK